MATAYTSGRTTVSIQDTTTNPLDLTTITDAFSKQYIQNWASGTGANQQQVKWHDQITLTSGSNVVLDLDATATAGGAVLCNNGMGNCTFAKIKEIFIYLSTATAGYEILVGAGSAPIVRFTNAETVQAGGMMLKIDPVDGIAVTAGTADLLKIDNTSAGSVTFDIFISGTGTVA
jgi:hypothetical protein